jgi:hypothetical protein
MARIRDVVPWASISGIARAAILTSNLCARWILTARLQVCWVSVSAKRHVHGNKIFDTLSELGVTLIAVVERER